MPISVSGYNWDQVIFPPIEKPSGVYEIRINADIAAYNLTISALLASPISIKLTKPARFCKDFGTFKKKRANAEGRIEVDSWTCTLKDFHEFAGTAAGGTVLGASNVDVDGDEYASTTTFLDRFFSRNLTFYVWVTKITNAGATREIVFAGEIDPTSIPRAHTLVNTPHATENRIQDVTLECNAAFGRLKNKTIQDFIDATTISDMVEPNSRPWYGGFAYNHVFKTPAPGYKDVAKYDSVTFDASILSSTGSTSWFYYFIVAAAGRKTMYNDLGDVYAGGRSDQLFPNTTTFEGEYGITFGKILSKIASIANLDFTETTDFTPAFHYNILNWNPGTLQYNRSAITQPWNICVSYNYVFGISPVAIGGVKTYCDFPITLKRDETLASVVGKIATQFGCRVEFTYDATSGKPRMSFVPLRVDNGPFPTGILANLESSKEIERATRATHVEVDNIGVQTTIKCPAYGKGDALKMTIPFRTRSYGTPDVSTGRWHWKDLIFFTGEGSATNGQLAFMRRNDGEPNKLEPNGWLHASYLYYYVAATANTAYPADIGDVNSPHAVDFPDADWDGYYMLEACTEKPSVYTSRSNTLFAPAQYYARELTLAAQPMQFERVYSGCLDDSGLMAGIKVGQTCTITITVAGSGVATTFRSVEVEIDVDTTSTKILWEEVPADYATLGDYNVSYIGDGAHTTATTASQGSSNGTGVNGGTTTSNGIGVKVGTTVVAHDSAYDKQGISPFSSGGLIVITQSVASDSGPPLGNWAGLDFNLAASVITGTGSAGFVSYFTGTSTLAASTFAFDGARYAINASPSSAAVLALETDDSATALLVNGSALATGHGVVINYAGTAAAGTTALKIDIASTNVIGQSITLPALSAKPALNVTHNGTGTAATFVGAGTNVVTIAGTANAALALYVRDSATTATVDVANFEAFGLRRALLVQRGNASATLPLAEFINSGANGQRALYIQQAANAAAIGIVATDSGANANAISASSAGTGATFYGTNSANGAMMELYRNVSGGTVAGVSIGLAHSLDTGIALSVTHAGNGKLASFYRNVSTASTDGVFMHLDHAGDNGKVLSVQQDGTGDAVKILVNSNAAALNLEGLGTGYGIICSVAGGSSSAYITAGTGLAIEAGGRSTFSHSSTDATHNTVAISRAGTTGNALYTSISNAGNSAYIYNSSTGRALYTQSDGGIAAEFKTTASGAVNGVIITSTSATNSAGALSITQSGTATAIVATRGNGSATTAVVDILNSGNDGQAVILSTHSGTTGLGIASYITNTSNASAAMHAESASTSASAIALSAKSTGSGGTAALRVQSTSTSFSGKLGYLTNAGTSYSLWVESTLSTNAADVGYLTTAGTGNCLKLNHTNAGTPTTTARNLIIGQASGTNVWRVDNTGKTFQNGGSQASGAGHAEMRLLETATTAVAGDVLILSTVDPKSVKKSPATSANALVCGVYSTRASYESVDVDDTALMAGFAGAIPCEINGIVPTKVDDSNGAIAIGDLLVTSGTNAGRAAKGSSPAAGTIIGKAMQAHAAGTGTIRVLLMLC